MCIMVLGLLIKRFLLCKLIKLLCNWNLLFSGCGFLLVFSVNMVLLNSCNSMLFSLLIWWVMW